MKESDYLAYIINTELKVEPSIAAAVNETCCNMFGQADCQCLKETL